MFDSKQYEWKDIQVVQGGENIAGIKEITYSGKRDKEALYGRGDKPHSIQSGNLEYEGQLVIFQSELKKLVAKAPKGDITLLSEDITVAYAPELGGKQTADLLIGVEFTEWNKGMAQGDKNAEITLPFLCLDIKEDV